MQRPLNKSNLMQIGIFSICKELQRKESAFAESRRDATDLKKKAEEIRENQMRTNDQPLKSSYENPGGRRSGSILNKPVQSL